MSDRVKIKVDRVLPVDGFGGLRSAERQLAYSQAPTPTIPWRPIAELPDALKDGREVLFHFPPVLEGGPLSCMAGYWWGSEWRLPTGSGIVGATHFAEINPPEGV